MSDVANVTLRVFDLPIEHLNAVLDIVNEHGLSEDYMGGGPLDTLTVGATYGSELRLGAEREIAEALMEKASGITFEVWQDPKYEYSGVVLLYAPDLGSWEGECNAEGEPYFTVGEIRKRIAEDDVNFVLKPDKVGQWLGLPWLDRIVKLEKEAAVD